jgi:hypothetical protein
MYDSIRIQNFRGIQDLTISDLGRINLIVGANNVGKTSVLEAIWLLTGRENPNLATATATRRGNDERINPIEVWKGLLGNEESDAPAVVEASGDHGMLQRLTIAFTPGPRSGRYDEHVVPRNGGYDRPGMYGRLEFRYVGADSPLPELVSSIEINSGGFVQNLGPRSGSSALYLGAGESPHSRELAIGFTQADDGGYLGSIVDALRLFDHRVERISLGLAEGEETPAIRVHLAGTRAPLPLFQMGGGLVRLVQMLILIPLHGSRPALIDEVDFGIYYETLPNVWSSLRSVANFEPPDRSLGAAALAGDVLSLDSRVFLPLLNLIPHDDQNL